MRYDKGSVIQLAPADGYRVHFTVVERETGDTATWVQPVVAWGVIALDNDMVEGQDTEVRPMLILRDIWVVPLPQVVEWYQGKTHMVTAVIEEPSGDRPTTNPLNT